MKKCRECNGKLKIIGTGLYGDTIEVECQACGEFYEVEPDELNEAQMIELEKTLNDS